MEDKLFVRRTGLHLTFVGIIRLTWPKRSDGTREKLFEKKKPFGLSDTAYHRIILYDITRTSSTISITYTHADRLGGVSS